MAHISNFKRFKILLENNNLNYLNSTSIFEAANPGGSGEKSKLAVKINGDDFPGEFSVPDEVFTTTSIATFMQSFKSSKMKYYFPRELKSDLKQLVASFLNGYFWSSFWGASEEKRKEKKEKFEKHTGDKKSWKYTDEQRFNLMCEWIVGGGNHGLKWSEMETLEVKADGTYIYAIGYPHTYYGPIKKIGTKTKGQAGYKKSIVYMNTVNIYNFMNGISSNYDLKSSGLIDDAYLNFSKKKTGLKPYFYVGEKIDISKVEDTESGGDEKIVGAKAGGEGSVNISFETGKYTTDTSKKVIDSTYKTIVDEANKIKSLLGEKDYVDSMTLVSSASPDWDNKDTQTMKLYKKEGKVTSGDADPGKGDDYASKNAKLAYDRGNHIAKILKELLGDRLPGTMKVKWKISTDGANGGKNASYTWNKASDPGKVFKTQAGKVSTGGDKSTTEGKKAGKIYAYKLKFNSGL